MITDTASAGNDGLTATSNSLQHLPNDVDLPSMFSHKGAASFRPSPYMEFEYSPFVMQHQDLINRHALCLTRLREKAREVEFLRRENATLRSFNRELNSHLRFLAQSSSLHKHNCLASSSHYNRTAPFGLSDSLRNLKASISDGGRSGGDETCEDENPTSVMEVQSADTERVSLPKSVSVRSNGYRRMSQPSVATTSNTPPTTSRRRSTSSLNGGQKVYVCGGKKEEEPLELEVYHQGTFKTELCNKWQETGACPYGDHCQFAHGIEDLRPVIRHPRYKTEVCRMVLAGDICPYGHRCHFRHALTEQDRYTGRLNLRAT